MLEGHVLPFEGGTYAPLRDPLRGSLEDKQRKRLEGEGDVGDKEDRQEKERIKMIRKQALITAR
jgi:hypothetical protein